LSLTYEQKWRIAGAFRNRKNKAGQVNHLTKTELFDAVSGIDAAFDSTASIFNLGIPLPARSILTASDKADLFQDVARIRFTNNGS